MFDRTRRDRARESDSDGIEQDLAELCRRHGVRLELIRDSRDIDDLIERVIADYESREAGPLQASDLRAVVAFACRASLLRARAMATVVGAGTTPGERGLSDTPAARIEKLGELLSTVGALIHKINNPLTALVGRAQLLRMQGELPPRVVRGAEVIEESSRRIAELTRELASRVKEGRRLAGLDGDGEDVATDPTEPMS